jgi:hypothetical protein
LFDALSRHRFFSLSMHRYEVTSPATGCRQLLSRRIGAKGQPSPQDVACGVFVSMGGVPAALATKFRFGDAILGRRVPA